MNDSRVETTVVIPNWNGMRWLPDCLAALERQTCPPARILVVDNGSEDDSRAWLRARVPRVSLIEQGRNTGFPAAVNAGIRAGNTPFIALLNTDTRASESWLERLQCALASAGPEVGAVCGKMLQMERPDRIENAGDMLSWQGAAEKRGYLAGSDALSEPGEVFSVCAGGALYRRSFFDHVGLFDESFFAYLEDIDLCLRGRLYGFRYAYEPRAVLFHHGHGSAMPSAQYVRLTTANRLRLLYKNIPAKLLVKKIPSLLYGQAYFFCCHRRPLAVLAGYRDFLSDLPALHKSRRAISAQTRLTPARIEKLLAPRMVQPGLGRSLRRFVTSKIRHSDTATTKGDSV